MPLTPPERHEQQARALHLPVRPFLYTLDQMCTLLALDSVPILAKTGYVYFTGRSTGQIKPDEMRAVNISSIEGKPDWRVEERELIRWMKRKGFTYVTR